VGGYRRVWRTWKERRAMSEPDQNSKKNTLAKVNNQELFHAPIDPNQQASNAEAGIRPVKNSPGFLLLLLGLIVVGAGAVLMLSQKGLKSAKASPDSDDLGAGISQASGLRGHLVTRWQGKAQYMLKIEPLDPRDAAGFAAVAANPSGPMSINIRLLDSSGFALCGKEIVLRFDPARIRRSNMQLPKKQSDAERLLAQQQENLQRVSLQEKERETGKDAFQNIQGSDGAVEALWAQGELPCSPDQYQRFDYWDLSTNFPTLAEQDHLLGRKPAETPRDVSARNEDGNNDGTQSERDVRGAAKRRAAKKLQPAYLIQGDDRATEFDSARGLLVVGASTRFLIDRQSDGQMVAGWADDDSLIHFTCDSHSICALRRAGSASVVPARMNE
jgi:hypothetical protein